MINLEKEINKNLKIFPTTRYQGSKRRLLPWLYEIFKDIKFNTVLDGFGGSASTSYLFKLMGKRVFYNDILKSTYEIGLALIENNSIKLDHPDIEFLLTNHNSQFPTFIAKTFENIYYYPEENLWLDLIVFNIKKLAHIYKGGTLKKKQALAFNSLFQACLSKRPFNLFHRKNLNLRKADVRRTFGNKKTWEIEFSVLFRKFALETSAKVFSNNQRNRAFCSDLLTLRKYDYDLVYLDPPYQRPSENHPKDYYSLYHFLDGLVDYDNWHYRIDISKKHKPLKKELSKFDNLSFLEKFNLILEKFDKSKIAISYGEPGKPTIDELKKLLSKYKSKVDVYDTVFSYKLNKKNGNKLREVLIVGS